MAFLQCMQAITRISIAFGRLNIYMWKTDLSWKDALRQYGRSPVEKLPEPFYLIPAYWSITNQAFHLPATTKKLLPSMVGSCCWVALLSRPVCVLCVSVCPASTTPLCPHGHRDTCPQGRPHTHSYNTSHRYRKPHLCKHLFVYLTVSMFMNSRPRSQVLRACMKLRTTA